MDPISARKVVAVALLILMEVMISRSSSMSICSTGVSACVSSSRRCCRCLSVATLPFKMSSFAGLSLQQTSGCLNNVFSRVGQPSTYSLRFSACWIALALPLSPGPQKGNSSKKSSMTFVVISHQILQLRESALKAASSSQL